MASCFRCFQEEEEDDDLPIPKVHKSPVHARGTTDAPPSAGAVKTPANSGSPELHAVPRNLASMLHAADAGLEGAQKLEDWDPGEGGQQAFVEFEAHKASEHGGEFRESCPRCFEALRKLRGGSLGSALPALPPTAVGQLSIQQVLAGLTELAEPQLAGLTQDQINFALPSSSEADLDEVVPRLADGQVRQLEGPALECCLPRLSPRQVQLLLPKLTGAQLKTLSTPVGGEPTSDPNVPSPPQPGIDLPPEPGSQDLSSAEMKKRGFVMPSPLDKGDGRGPRFFGGTTSRVLEAEYEGKPGGGMLRGIGSFVAAPVRGAGGIFGAVAAAPVWGAGRALGLAGRGVGAAARGTGRAARAAAEPALAAAGIYAVLKTAGVVGRGPPNGWRKTRGGQYFYTVRDDETLSEIRQKFRRHWGKIAAQNEGMVANPEWLYAGDRFYVDKF